MFFSPWYLIPLVGTRFVRHLISGYHSCHEFILHSLRSNGAVKENVPRNKDRDHFVSPRSHVHHNLYCFLHFASEPALDAAFDIRSVPRTHLVLFELHTLGP